ncbi:MAG: hypothetical protein H0W83_00845 [Planctomycetes bacterium]|nr:hypothetical protein [Planctomycetota bacterium]
MKIIPACLAVALALVLLPVRLAAADAASPAAEPVLEPSTTTCLGVYWIVRGDDDGDGRVALAWRVAGAPEWTPGADLFRVVKGHHKQPKGASLDIPDDARLFAGSVLWLKPGTDYELRLSLADPDGGAAEKILHARTAVEPFAAKDAPIRHVAPGDGGGTGTTDDPFKGLAAAHAAAKPGDIMLLHAGVYGPLPITVSGEPGKPIVWRGTDDGEAIIDGGGVHRVIAAVGVHDVWFENLTVRNGERGIAFHESQRIVVRRCHLYKLVYPIAATVDKGNVGFFICDNLIEGPCVWPRTDAKGIEAERGIQVIGEGHEICYNRVRGFADAIDTFQEGRCSATAAEVVILVATRGSTSGASASVPREGHLPRGP